MSIRAAARASGIPRGTLVNRVRSGLTLDEAVALGRRSQREAHPRSEVRAAREAAGVPRSTARRRARAGLPLAEVARPGKFSRGETLVVMRMLLEQAGRLAGLHLQLIANLPVDARAAVERWGEMCASDRALWVIRGATGGITAFAIARLLDEAPGTIRNVLSGLRSRGMIRRCGRAEREGNSGPRMVPLWAVTRKGASDGRDA